MGVKQLNEAVVNDAPFLSIFTNRLAQSDYLGIGFTNQLISEVEKAILFWPAMAIIGDLVNSINGASCRQLKCAHRSRGSPK